VYYRLEQDYQKQMNTFIPSSYWERVNDEKNDVVISYDRNLGEEFIMKSLIPEICFAKTIGGCLAALSSSFVKSRDEIVVKEEKKVWHMYVTEQTPCIDLTPFKHLDFKYTEEVRYQKNVEVTYAGRLVLDDSACFIIEQIAKTMFKRPDTLIYSEEQGERLTFLIKELNDYLDHPHTQLTPSFNMPKEC